MNIPVDSIILEEGTCNDDKIFNASSGICVSKNGIVGKKLIASFGNYIKVACKDHFKFNQDKQRCMSTKTKIIPAGTLSKYGYHGKEPEKIRREALVKAIKEYGHSVVTHKLNAVSILQKNKNPALSKIFRDDMIWVKENYQ